MRVSGEEKGMRINIGRKEGDKVFTVFGINFQKFAYGKSEPSMVCVTIA
jgi:hypothetical protein